MKRFKQLAHNQKILGSTPIPATNLLVIDVRSCYAIPVVGSGNVIRSNSRYVVPENSDQGN